MELWNDGILEYWNTKMLEIAKLLHCFQSVIWLYG
jgi:hypothetical protein